MGLFSKRLRPAPSLHVTYSNKNSGKPQAGSDGMRKRKTNLVIAIAMEEFY